MDGFKLGAQGGSLDKNFLRGGGSLDHFPTETEQKNPAPKVLHYVHFAFLCS